ncbi:MAG: valine--tRNA ligase [Bacteroidia bacterium]|nr:MAG: valine--tRNA ligase [Bacteroidia bacterium]
MMAHPSTKYNPTETEKKWYQFWLDNQFFQSKPDDRVPYTVVIPPPNVTGILHMGHILNNTIQDILVRRARMQGKNACWVPGTDHASIATEAKVVAKLNEEGIQKKDLSREEFLKHAMDWTDKHGGIILEQLKKMGASCDWDRTRFTLDDNLYKSVIKVFVDFYNKGLIYRGLRMINWDVKAQTAVSDEEVFYKEEQSKLYYLKYKIKGTEQFIHIATTRPETILGDTAVCVHPEDERYKQWHGKQVIVPLVNRTIPIITDEYVDREFGTGALKITPAHDENDYKLGQKHNLEIIDIFNDDGTLNADAQFFTGRDRFEVRQLIIPELEQSGNLLKVEDYKNKVGYSERTGVAIEPKLSTQWFLKMKDLAKPALENVMNDKVQFHPPKFKNMYRHWMENIRDWNISRQLWWGHRIPAYYLPDNKTFVVAESPEKALKLAQEKSNNKNLTIQDLKQDEDVLDTWFSSWLWPISVFNGILEPDNQDIKYYYPTNDLVTAPEIIFFWVARMIVAGYAYKQDLPFKNVYFTGIVRDKQGRKMSKSLGNSPDALGLIEKYGADAVRIGMMFCSPAGGDLLYDDSLPEQGRNFANKIWNAYRLLQNQEIDTNIPQPEHAQKALTWFKHKFNKELQNYHKQLDEYRISESLITVYKLFRDDFSSRLLEIIKPAYQQPMDAHSHAEAINFLEDLLYIIHPFMPFITEEIWQRIRPREAKQSIVVAKIPEAQEFDSTYIDRFEQTMEIISHIRNIRKQKNIPGKTKPDLFYKTIIDDTYNDSLDSVIRKLGQIENIHPCTTPPASAAQFIVKNTEYYIPLEGITDPETEKKNLEKELKYAQGFLQSVTKKLNNERFVANAPQQVIEKEKQKQTDAEAKIKALEEQLRKYN